MERRLNMAGDAFHLLSQQFADEFLLGYRRLSQQPAIESEQGGMDFGVLAAVVASRVNKEKQELFKRMF